MNLDISSTTENLDFYKSLVYKTLQMNVIPIELQLYSLLIADIANISMLTH